MTFMYSLCTSKFLQFQSVFFNHANGNVLDQFETFVVCVGLELRFIHKGRSGSRGLEKKSSRDSL